ncbi:putative transcription factor interactor and regulator CCHC(Zn) family [Rosa chinensis]|uniref:Putative transcription factor interactor and regulator CCHC(Zn) family n=1 Tax=Rosa chinensis TaxID=74649 RepID=A0A2P6S5J0_ROSCH|nr:putative transcription factor interactor and regulator CCHC(Zn) family [Rosa chinensis]
MGKPNVKNAYTFMHSGLKRKWNPQGPWQLIDLPYDFYIVKFTLESDLNVALCGGPWILAGQTLVVQKWRPEFDPTNEKINNMAVWVRILGLPVRYFKDYTLRVVGKVLGTVIKIDKLTLAQARGKFARICVEIDLQTPLKPFVEIEGVAYGIVYEGISLICFNCGCYGHAKANCPHSDPSKPVPDAETQTNPKPHTSSDSTAVHSPQHPTETAVHITTNHQCNDMEIADQNVQATQFGHGPWMLMSYKNKKANPNKIPANSAQVQSGSRFTLLETFVEGEENALNEVQPTPIVSLDAKDNPEPAVVRVWKQVQKKANMITANIGKPSGSQKKPLKDITNGKSSLRPSVPKFNLGKKSTQPSGKHIVTTLAQKSKATSQPISIDKNQSSVSSSSVQDSHPPSNFSAKFGNCLPESCTNLEPTCTEIYPTNDGSTSNGQVCSVLASDNLNNMISIVSGENTNLSSNVEDMVDN